jgi:diguanylate cyclase (GGDEF)-like protein
MDDLPRGFVGLEVYALKRATAGARRLKSPRLNADSDWMFGRSPHRTNPASVAALLVGIALIPVGVGAIVVEHSRESDARNRALANEARTQAERLDSYFSRARSLTQITARNPSFRDFYDEPGGRGRKIRAQGRTLQNANSALAYLEKLFPHSIGEACFIDHSGPENARAVKGRIQPPSALSPDETANPFFDPSFALPPGQVFQSRPYVSPDTNEWVVANATPIRSGAHSKPAIVHFEITVESMRGRAASSSERFDVAIVDARTGMVIVDSRYPQRAGKPRRHMHASGVHLHPAVPLGRPQDHRFKQLVDSAAPAGTLEVGGRPAAYTKVDLPGHNQNHWLAVAVSPTPAPALYESLGLSEIAMLIGALLLLGFAVATLRSSQLELRDAALKDSLTAMPNRRSLMADLERQVRDASPKRPLMLALFDLDGFKAYNDTFGHPVGDHLLARLGQNLSATMSGRGTAYRMGGDEFCVLAATSGDDHHVLLGAAAAALSDQGQAFSVTASYGSVLLPTETSDPAEALRRADQRMYAQKGLSRASAGRQSTDVLTRVVTERDPELGVHLDEVTELCRRTARCLRVPDEEMTALTQAAILHDVGKAAIPDAILSKPEPLSDEDAAFIRRHTIIGERILGAAPALAKAAKLVRATHERFDGAGYPDSLSGEDIPLGARIIGVCDAYHAMISDRPYRRARTSADAIAELRRCAGTQFDPMVVEAFCAALTEAPAAADAFAQALSV